MLQQIRYAFLASLITLAIQGQTVDTAILGTVKDAGGASVPNAQIVISQPATGLSRSIQSGPEGTFEVRYLVPGDYVVEVQAQGFRTERRTGINIQIGQQAKLEFTLQVGQVQQTLEVQAAAPLLQTENATLGGVVGP